MSCSVLPEDRLEMRRLSLVNVTAQTGRKLDCFVSQRNSRQAARARAFCYDVEGGNNFEVTAYTQTTVGAFWHRTPASPSLMSGSLQLPGSLQPPHRAGAAGDPASY
jgi:hypothetical protein